MAHFAKLNEENVVETVLVVDNKILLNSLQTEEEVLGIEYLKSIFGESTRWVQTSYNNNFRSCMAAPNYIYDPTKDVFIPPKPYSSWIFNDSDNSWIPPIPYPNDGNSYVWDENIQTWIEG